MREDGCLLVGVGLSLEGGGLLGVVEPDDDTGGGGTEVGVETVIGGGGLLAGVENDVGGGIKEGDPSSNSKILLSRVCVYRNAIINTRLRYM